MCIVLATTAHPDYALIVLDNRDEFILRSTSRPHWWSKPNSHQEILSSRDLQRAEQGTWMGITKSGNFAVLTNYKEDDTEDRPLLGQRSRGGMVTAWLTADPSEGTSEFVHRLLAGEGVKGVGGFSLLCGKLRKSQTSEGIEHLDPLAIVSNRAGTSDDVPRIAGSRGEVYALSNTFFNDPVAWPKVEMGKELLLSAVEGVVKTGGDRNDLVARLFEVLDTDTLPKKKEEETFQEFTYQLRKSIFVPVFGQSSTTLEADAIATADPSTTKQSDSGTVKMNNDPQPYTCDMSGAYGTQRQTIILVDWEGNITFIERALWDESGKSIPKGEGDVEFSFQIEGWEEQSTLHASHI